MTKDELINKGYKHIVKCRVRKLGRMFYDYKIFKEKPKTKIINGEIKYVTNEIPLSLTGLWEGNAIDNKTYYGLIK